MEKLAIIATFVSVILGLAYPIILQVTFKFDEKYSSTFIVNIFKKEKIYSIFKWILYLSLFFILLSIIQIPPAIYFENEIINSILENSSYILALIFSSFLVIVFLLFIKKIMIYNTPEELIKYFIKKFQSETDFSKTTFLKALIDLLNYSIEQGYDGAIKEIHNFLNEIFTKESDKSIENENDFPISYYQAIEKISNKLLENSSLRNEELKKLENYILGSRVYFGDYQDGLVLSKETLYYIALNIKNVLSKNRISLFKEYWCNANDYMSYSLNKIYQEIDSDGNVTNKKEIEKREELRAIFFNFNITLGAHLLENKKYDCIKEIFEYTNSLPPRYELLPDNIQKILEMYMQIRDIRNNYYRQSFFGFDKIGISGEFESRRCIQEYLSVLYLRLYKYYYETSDVRILISPLIPKTVSDMSYWYSNLDYFISLVRKNLNNQNLIDTIGLKFLNEAWCQEMRMPMPDVLLSNFKININNEIKRNLEEQEPSVERVKKTDKTAIEYLKEADSSIKKLTNKNKIESDFISYYINGAINYILEKSAFCDNQKGENVDYDSFVPGIVKNNFLDGFYHSFMINTKRYIIKEEQMEDAIGKLNLNANEHIIICFGETLSKSIPSNYKNKIVITREEYYHRFLFNSLIILRNDELPQITYKDYPKDSIDKYFLNPIDNDLKIYAAVNDLNKRTELRNELQEKHQDKNLKEYVLQCLWINPEIRWKKVAKKVLIVQYSKFKEDGILSNVNDIKNFSSL